jgi:hypothetical protein
MDSKTSSPPPVVGLLPPCGARLSSFGFSGVVGCDRAAVPRLPLAGLHGQRRMRPTGRRRLGGSADRHQIGVQTHGPPGLLQELLTPGLVLRIAPDLDDVRPGAMREAWKLVVACLPNSSMARGWPSSQTKPPEGWLVRSNPVSGEGSRSMSMWPDCPALIWTSASRVT